MTEGFGVRLRQCVILVGGVGSRLGAITATTPKPVLTVGDRPFLAWLLHELCRYGFSEVLLLVGYLPDMLRVCVEEIALRLPRPMRVVYSQESGPAGTGGALFHARALLDARFLLCNGDSLFDCNLASLLSASSRDSEAVLGRLLLRQVDDTGRCGVVTVLDDRVTSFRERGRGGEAGAINAGIGIYGRQLVDHLTERCSLEGDVLPGLAAAGRLRAQIGVGRFVDIGVPDDLARARRDLPGWLRRPALFLDRDGVINVDHGYVGTIERFVFTTTALVAIAETTMRGWHVFIVTNQSGIARGLYDEAAVHRLHDWVLDQVLLAGGTIDDVRYCPYHPEGTVAAYARGSDWRKPAPGMLLDLIRRWELDPARCVLVGDQQSDLAAAAAAGVAGHLLMGGDLMAFVRPFLADPS